MTQPPDWILTALAWAGTAAQIGGAFGLASRWQRAVSAYWVMLAGSGIWLGLAVLRADWPLSAMMGAYCLINVWGIWRWGR